MAETTRKYAGYGGLGLLALIAIAGLAYLGSRPDIGPTPAAPPPPAAITITPPAFDVVRVDGDGNAVLAGRAAPGALVTIKNGTDTIGTVTADARGAFVLVPAKPLPPGAQEISLSEKLPDGTIVKGSETASIDVPKGGGKALTVLNTKEGSAVLSGQGPQPGTLGIGSVDYDANGHAIISGTAPAGARVDVTLSGKPLGRVAANAQGRWRLTTKVPSASGTLSVAATTKDGTPLPPVTAPFALETLPTALANGHVVIAPGDNLWLIARRVYGHGNLYTLIYGANSSAIHNPDLIFPGQNFALPKPQS